MSDEDEDFREKLADLMDERGYVALDPEELFRRGVDFFKLHHLHCGGRIRKLAPGFWHCDHARCERCGKEGAVRLATNDQGESIVEVEEDVVRPEEPLVLADGTVVDEWVETTYREMAIFDDEPVRQQCPGSPS